MHFIGFRSWVFKKAHFGTFCGFSWLLSY